MKISLILTCAGSGNRAGFSKNKLLVPFNGQTVMQRAYFAFVKSGLIDQYIITASEQDIEEVSRSFPDCTVVLGGNTRTQSVKNALSYADGEIVLIHDGARPFVTTQMISDCIDTVKNYGGAIPVIPSRDTIAEADTNINHYVGKDGIYIVQTPQGFFTDEIKKAYSLSDGIFNDDGEVYGAFIKKPAVYNGDYANVKLTYPEDFERLISYNDCRFGTGFDCHRLVENRKLILGGIEIPHDKGLLGHSDADVLTHAIMDAILSAISQRDIGFHFPDNDQTYKDCSSMKLLEKVLEITSQNGYSVKSVSAVIMAQKPKLLPHIPSITSNLAKALNVSEQAVGISATTLEGLGFVGREEGICVNATAVVIKA